MQDEEGDEETRDNFFRVTPCSEAIADLKEALRGYIDAFGLEDALARLNTPSLRFLDWNLAELTRG